MKKGIFFKIAISCIILLILLIVGGVIALQSINTDQIKNMLATQVQKSTGRILTIKGPVELKIGLVPRVVVNDVTLSNPAGSSRPEMVTLKRFEMEVALTPLLQKQVMVNKLILVSPDVLIETEASGPGNLDFSPPEQSQEPKAEETATQKVAPETDQSAYSLAFKELSIEQGVFTLYDRTSKKSERVDIDLLTIRPNGENPSLLDLKLVTKARGQQLDLSGTIGNIDTILQQKPWPLAIKAAVAGVTLQASGSIENLKALQGVNLKLDLSTKEMTKVVALLGDKAPKLPDSLGPVQLSAQLAGSDKALSLNNINLALGKKELATVHATGTVANLLGTPTPHLKVALAVDNPANLTPLTGSPVPLQGPLALQAQVKGSKSNWNISGIKLTTKSSDLEGNLAVKLGKRPLLSGSLESKVLAVADFTPQEGTAAATQPAKAQPGKKDGRLFSDEPLPLAALQSADAKIQIKVDKLILDKQTLTNSTVTLSLNNGLLSVDPFSTGVAGGTLKGAFSLDGGHTTPTMALHLKGNSLNLGSLQDKGAMDGGKTDLNIHLQSSGKSVRALMGSLTGESVISVGSAKLANKSVEWLAGDFIFQLLGSINPFVSSEKYTQMSCAVVRFVVNDGVATADKGIAMRTDKVDVIGSGTINLKNEQLDLGIKPHARGGVGISLSSPLAGLVKIKGTLAQPSMGLDTVGTMKTAVSLGAGVATGGLSTLGELLVDKVVADSDPCQTALGKTSTGSKTNTATSKEHKDSSAKPASIEQQLLQNVFGN